MWKACLHSDRHIQVITDVTNEASATSEEKYGFYSGKIKRKEWSHLETKTTQYG